MKEVKLSELKNDTVIIIKRSEETVYDGHSFMDIVVNSEIITLGKLKKQMNGKPLVNHERFKKHGVHTSINYSYYTTKNNKIELNIKEIIQFYIESKKELNMKTKDDIMNAIIKNKDGLNKLNAILDDIKSNDDAFNNYVKDKLIDINN